MPKPTRSSILKRLNSDCLNLYQGKGKDYWYFVYDDTDANIYHTYSVMVKNLKDMTLEQWVDEGKYFINRIVLQDGS